MQSERNDEVINVAVVCGTEVSIYGPKDGNRRPYKHTLYFRNHGEALQYASEYENNAWTSYERAQARKMNRS